MKYFVREIKDDGTHRSVDKSTSIGSGSSKRVKLDQDGLPKGVGDKERAESLHSCISRDHWDI